MFSLILYVYEMFVPVHCHANVQLIHRQCLSVMFSAAINTTRFVRAIVDVFVHGPLYYHTGVHGLSSPFYNTLKLFNVFSFADIITRAAKQTHFVQFRNSSAAQLLRFSYKLVKMLCVCVCVWVGGCGC